MKKLALPWFAALPLLATACQSTQMPRVAVSDPAVFTTLHILVAEAGSALETANGPVTFNNGPFTSAQMRRFFETNPKEFDTKKARADAMLEGQQVQSAFFEAFKAQSEARLLLASNGSTAATTQQARAAASSQADADAKIISAALEGTAPLDSPFYQLDRVADFYASYIIKTLRVRGDSRVIDPSLFINPMLNMLPDNEYSKKLREIALTQDDKYLDGDRLLLVIFQAQIDPGTTPDMWAGVRLKITQALKGKENASLDDVRIIRLHPAHTYSIDMQNYGRTATRSISLALQGGGSIQGLNISGEGSSTSTAEEQERRRFLSRLTENASIADAAAHEFGFNFYPTNIRVDPSDNPFAALTGNTFTTRGYLEAGARDCAAMIVVPRALTSFTCEVRYVYGNVNGGPVNSGAFLSDNPAPPEKQTHSLTVELPKWKSVELAAATIGIAPAILTAPPKPSTTASTPNAASPNHPLSSVTVNPETGP